MKRRGALARVIPFLVTAGLALAIDTLAVFAQEAAGYTLHVYTNLVQVPALVLTRDRKPVPPIKLDQFSISLDHGPLFHPSQMRMEGDDSISLAVLLDVSGASDDIVKSFIRDFPKLAPESLHPKDRVSIYAIDCALVQSAAGIPADPEALKTGMDSALASPGLHGTKQHGSCPRSVHLWDAVVQISNALGNLPGHPVLLVVSDGKDGKSTASFAEANAQAIHNSVAIFGLRDWAEVRAEKDAASQSVIGPNTGGRAAAAGIRVIASSAGKDEDLENPFDLLCGGNGGFVQNLSQRDVAKSTQNLVALLRNRYILQYPRPDDGTPGMHTIEITVTGAPNRVWAPGVSYPTADPAVLADPSTVRSAPSPATFGTRRPVDAKK
jgi:hypothetical protein